jgi:D-inositol-3-phosphate glycosyltransferase
MGMAAECRKDHFVLLFVGRIEPLKGLNDVIEALRIMKEKNPSLFVRTKLMVAGGGQKDEELAANTEVSRIRKAVEQHGLQDAVVFLGSVKQAELRKYYSNAHVLVVPSLYESFGLVTVEALACGTPVLVSQVDRMKSIVEEGKNGFSFRPNDPVSLWRCLERFYSSRSRFWPSTVIREDAIKRFCWENAAEKTARIFEALIETRRRIRTISPPGESPLPV